VTAQNGAGSDSSAGTAATGLLSPEVPVGGFTGLMATVLATSLLGALRLRRRTR